MKKSLNAKEVGMLIAYINCGLQTNDAMNESATKALLGTHDAERTRRLMDIARCEATGYTLQSVLGFIEGLLK